MILIAWDPPHQLDLHLGDTWRASLVTSILEDDGSTFSADTEDIRFDVQAVDGDTYRIQISRKLVATKLAGVDVPDLAKTAPLISVETISKLTCFVLPLTH